MGRPGSGKTSLVREFADVFGIKYENIAVQANWTDRSDLLGYYNPIEKSYVSTPFLDCLLRFWHEAKENEDKLFFICLDEMNLSHIEYYFADFLSVLQEPDSNKRKIKLYSKHLRDSILKELQCIGIADEDISKSIKGNEMVSDEKWNKVYGIVKSQADILKQKYYFELCQSLKMLCDFPCEIDIPPKIKFIGTLNQDETTLDISPKVIDRSYIVRFTNLKETLAVSTDGGSISNENERIKYKYIKEYDENERKNKDEKEPFAVNQLYNNPSEKTDSKRIGNLVRYSQRIYKQTFGRVINDKDGKKFNEYEKWCKVIGQNEVDDYLLAATVLPRIKSAKGENEETDAAIKELGELVKEYKLSKEIYDEINREDTVNFWS